MDNNDVFRRLRYIFDFGDSKMITLFGLAGTEVDRTMVSNWLKKDEDPDFKNLPDRLLAVFLNGLIIDRRGKKDGRLPEPEKRLNNNIILRKLKIALELKDTDMLDILKLADFNLGKHELSAFFRKPGQGQYRECKDQVMRKFLQGLAVKYRPDNNPLTGMEKNPKT